MSPRILSLFSGYGGLDMGVQRAIGGTVIAHSEIDAAAVRILAHHHPDVPQLGDITAADLSRLGRVDVVTGGFPCQDVSLAGARAGLIRAGEDRTRSGLWGAMAGVVSQVRPRLVVIENVRGLLSANADSDVESCPVCVGDERGGSPVPLRALGAVLGDLADIGYDAAWRSLTAASVGACHQRSRVFIIAQPSDSEGDPWRVHDGERADTGHGGASLPTPRASDGEHGGPNQRGSRGDLTVSSAVHAPPTPRVTDGGGSGEHGTGGLDLRTAVSMLNTPRAAGGTEGEMTPPSAPALPPTPSVAQYPTNGSVSIGATRRPTLHGPIQWGKYESTIRRAEEAFGHPAPPPTAPAGRHGNHRPNPAFVEWMMMLPAGHVTGVPGLRRTQMLKALGNGVVPPQAAAAVSDLLHRTGWGVAA